ncbi:MAG: RidA family protein [Alphaproteobacteria bacterium]|nr:RidA family protein [Alphaproteobacteria bacterium]
MTTITRSLANYAPARRAGDFIFVSGASARQPDNTVPGAKLVNGAWEMDIRLQTEATLRRIDAVLATHDAGLADVVEANVFLLDMADYAGMNEVWNRIFADPAKAPARTTVAVRQLPRPELNVEIRAVAWKKA